MPIAQTASLNKYSTYLGIPIEIYSGVMAPGIWG